MTDSTSNPDFEYVEPVRIRTGPQWLSNLKRRVGKRLVDDE